MSEIKKSSWIFFVFFLVLGIYLGMKLPSNTRSKQNFDIDKILQIVEDNYVDTIALTELQNMAVGGFLNSLDPHTMYLPPQETQTTHEGIQGNFVGIGVQFRIINDTVNVIMPIVGGPSEKAGIKAGDQILSAGKTKLSGVDMTMENVMRHLKGEKGTTVELEIKRYGLKEPLYIKITRDEIKTHSVSIAYMVEPTIGYIKIDKFTARTGCEFKRKLEVLKEQGMKRLILDLRSNGGGLLSSAIDVVDNFLAGKDLIVYTKGAHRPKKEYRATNEGGFIGKPLVLLIDEGSASASEIVAGAIQDNDRGTIVGRRSFGKGLVQEQMDFKNGASMLLTVAKYYTPLGRSIQKPYQLGQIQNYEEDLISRYRSGELLNEDSVKLNKSEVYYTPKGKKVYGGGGIMPDIYVPYQINSLAIYYNQLSNAGLIIQFAFDYTNKNRAALEKYQTLEDFRKNFIISESIMQEFLRYVKTKGIDFPQVAYLKYKSYIEHILKAQIARNLHDDDWFYPIYLDVDDDFQRALKEIKA